MTFAKLTTCAAIAVALLTTAAPAQSVRSKSPQAAYAPETWTFKVAFRRFPWDITCREKNNRGKLVKDTGMRSVTYKLSGFPEADGLLCQVDNDPKRQFSIDVDNLFGVGRKKRVMGGEYFQGEVKRVDLDVLYQSNAVGYGSYKGHAKRFTVFGKDRIIYSEQGMFAAFFPSRANQPAKRWKP